MRDRTMPSSWHDGSASRGNEDLQQTPSDSANDEVPRLASLASPRRGLRYGDFRGQWPGEIDDGFENWVREMRDSEIEKELPVCP